MAWGQSLYAVRERQGGVDAEFARFVGGGRDYAAFVAFAADYYGFAFQRWDRTALPPTRRMRPCRRGRRCGSRLFAGLATGRSGSHGNNCSHIRTRGIPARSGRICRLCQSAASADTASACPKPISSASRPPGLRTRQASRDQALVDCHAGGSGEERQRGSQSRTSGWRVSRSVIGDVGRIGDDDVGDVVGEGCEEIGLEEMDVARRVVRRLRLGQTAVRFE